MAETIVLNQAVLGDLDHYLFSPRKGEKLFCIFYKQAGGRPKLGRTGPTRSGSPNRPLGIRAGAKHYARREWSARAIQHWAWAGPTVVVYIEDALAELLGGRQFTEDLPPTMVRLEKAEDQFATFVKALNKRIAS